LRKCSRRCHELGVNWIADITQLFSLATSAWPLRWFGTGRPVLEQDVEHGELSVTARDILLQVELVRFAQFVARVHPSLENAQIIPDHDYVVEEYLERDFF